MASPPFNPNEAVPGDSDVASVYPTAERAFRDIMESWMLVGHDRSGNHTGALPVGTVLDYAGTTEPSGFLFCFGQAVSRTTYSALFAKTGTAFGVGDGSTTFNLPDARGRVVAGQDDMGGVSADRLATFLDGDTFGNAGGTEEGLLDVANIPLHTHEAGSFVAAAHAHFSFSAVDSLNEASPISNSLYPTRALSEADERPSYTIQGTAVAATLGLTSSSGTLAVSGTSGGTGSGAAHGNVQPTIILNKIIFTGVF